MGKCVNIKDKHFKATAKKFDVHESVLKHIVYTYINAKGNEQEDFPSDEYIQKKLQANPIKGFVPTVQLIEQRNYNIPTIYSTLEKAQERVEELSKYINRDSIIYYRDNKGNYKVSIGEIPKYLQKQADREKLINATVIWEHPEADKNWTSNQKNIDIIDFDSEFKKSIIEEFGSIDKAKEELSIDEYNEKIYELFKNAVEIAKTSNKKLLIHNSYLLEEHLSDIDAIINISNKNLSEINKQQNIPQNKLVNIKKSTSELFENNNNNESKKVSEITKAIEKNEKRSELKERLRKLYPNISLRYSSVPILDLLKNIVNGTEDEIMTAIKNSANLTKEQAIAILDSYNRKQKGIEFQLSKGRKKDFIQRLANKGLTKLEEKNGKLIPINPEEVGALFAFLDTINNRKYENTIFRWYINGAINISEDLDKITYAMELMDKYHADPRMFNRPMEVINLYSQKEYETALKNAKEVFKLYENSEYFSNPEDWGDFVIYDVANSSEAGRWISENIITKFYDRSPWCIFSFNNNGKWVGEAYWYHYSAIPRRIAISKFTGIPLYMNASDSYDRNVWWDENDIENYILPKQGSYIDDKGKIHHGTKVYKGSKKNGKYVEYSPNNTQIKIYEQNKVGGKLHGDVIFRNNKIDEIGVDDLYIYINSDFLSEVINNYKHGIFISQTAKTPDFELRYTKNNKLHNPYINLGNLYKKVNYNEVSIQILREVLDLFPEQKYFKQEFSKEDIDDLFFSEFRNLESYVEDYYVTSAFLENNAKTLKDLNTFMQNIQYKNIDDLLYFIYNQREMLRNAIIDHANKFEYIPEQLTRFVLDSLTVRDAFEFNLKSPSIIQHMQQFGFNSSESFTAVLQENLLKILILVERDFTAKNLEYIQNINNTLTILSLYQDISSNKDDNEQSKMINDIKSIINNSKDKNSSNKEEENYENFEDNYYYRDSIYDIIPEEFFYQFNNTTVLGVSDLRAMAILIDSVNQVEDTLPHEYAHHYINWFINTDIVQQGIKEFGSEEALVQAIGEQTIKQDGKARTWWRRFTDFIINLFTSNNGKTLKKLTDAFLSNKILDTHLGAFSDATKEDVNKLMDSRENSVNLQYQDAKNLENNQIVYTAPGQPTRTYTIKGNQIFNSEGKEVFQKDSVHRNKIYANFAIKQGRAVVVEYKNHKYVVNNKGDIISVTSGNKMTWADNNDNRIAITNLANDKFKKIQQITTPNNSQGIKHLSELPQTTEQLGVVINSAIFNTSFKEQQDNVSKWQAKNPNGIVAYRVAGTHKFNTDREAFYGRIGNPFFKEDEKVTAAQKFYDWLITGNNFGNSKATDEYRQAIIKRILKTPENAPILYYTELNMPSHATVIGYLVHNKHLLNDNLKPISNTIQTSNTKTITPKTRSEYTNHSGGAKGADTVWGEIGLEYGIISNHYTFNDHTTSLGNIILNEQQLLEADEHIKQANEHLNRQYPTSSKYIDNLLKRNWYQVKNSDAIYAIGTIDMNTKTVNRDTGWAVQMAMDNNKPVYVFDQEREKWYRMGRHQVDGSIAIIETDTPILTKNFAGIGTRDINDAGRQAIKDVYAKTFNNTQTTKQEQTTVFEKGTIVAGEDISGKTLVEAIQHFENNKDGIFSNSVLQEILKLAKAQKIKANLQTTTTINNTVDTSTKENTDVSKKSYNKLNLSEEDKIWYNRQLEINKQLNNLLNSKYLTNFDIKNIAKDIVFWISDHITALQNDKELAEKIYGEQFKDKDFTTMSRLEIVNTVGINNIINRCKEMFKLQQFKQLSSYIKRNEIVSNFDAIMVLASDSFNLVEEFSIVFDPNTKTTTAVEGVTNPDVDNLNDSQDLASIQENVGNLLERWQVEIKTLDVLSTMTKDVKRVLLGCFKLDHNFNKVNSEFNISQRIDLRESVNAILEWTQGANTLEKMITQLEEKQKTEYWLKQVIDILKDTSNPVLQSQFFSAFNKHFQTYSIVTYNNGTYKSIIVNEKLAVKEAIETITTKYQLNSCPLFTLTGINNTSFLQLQSAIEQLTHFNNTEKNLEEEINKKEAAEIVSYISNIFGYNIIPEIITPTLTKSNFYEIIKNLNNIVRILKANQNNTKYNPFDYKSHSSILGYLQAFLKPITANLEHTLVNSVYDNGKMYQSHITPSYTTKLFQKFRTTNNEEFKKFIKEEFDVPWFHYGNDLDKGWRNEILRTLIMNPESRQIFDHKVQLNFNKHNYMKNMSAEEYTLSVLSEYFSGFNNSNEKSKVPVWFRMPIMSNKPSSEFFKFYAYVGEMYKESIVSGIKGIFDQEISRIQTVEMRNLQKTDTEYIKNFDKNGRVFCFLDYMNEYLIGEKKNSELGKLIRKQLNNNITPEEISTLNLLVKKVILENMESIVSNTLSLWESSGIIKNALSIENIGNEETIKRNLENFIWNDTFAQMNILQITITDTAYYKNAEDLQKRLAQIHAPGVRGNIDAVDFNGNKVSDGKFRTIKIADFDNIVSNIIDNISIVFARKITNAKNKQERAGYEILKDSLVGENGAFRQINVTDGQGYSSPTSYRKKAFIFGKWNKQSEDLYNKLLNGTYNYQELAIALQPLKPFVYSQIMKDSGVEGAPLSTIKIPMQFKNSEYLLILADAILKGEDTGNPNLLRAIYEVMEDSHFDNNGNYKTNGIDTVQFNSAIKSGEGGVISINEFIDQKGGTESAKRALEAAIYESKRQNLPVYNIETGQTNVEEVMAPTGNYTNCVDVLPMEDYCLQQEIPGHFRDYEQLHGSQIRMLIMSELESIDAIGNEVTYNLDGRQVSAEEFKKEYFEAIAENIKEDIEELSKDLGLGENINPIEKRIAISKILQREILSSPRYGTDLLRACTIDEFGEFRIPLSDPIQSKRIEQLLNSIIKNRINKQKIPGGPAVQVSAYGTSKKLNIRFKSKDGGLLMTKEEYEKSPIVQMPSQRDKFKARYKGVKNNTKYLSYKDYVAKNQAGIAYFEAYVSPYSNELFKQFADSNGIINPEILEMIDPDLLKMVGYRIPTEDKYSMTPIKIVGFLPKEAGNAIMLPYDITTLTGSDFDIDKEYLMRLDINIKKKDMKYSEISKLLYNHLIESQNLDKSAKRSLKDFIDDFLRDPFNSKSTYDIPKIAYKKLLKFYFNNAYTIEKPISGRAYRNNKIVQMTYEVLTHKTSADKVLNPGNFDKQKKIGYLIDAYKKYNNKYTWEQLQKMSIEELKELSNSNKNLNYINTQIQFYNQNNAAGSLIGIFAVNRVSHGVIESASNNNNSVYFIDLDKIQEGLSFNICGNVFKNRIPIDMRYNNNGKLIGKEIGSLVAASADAVKDPVLNLMNINSKTAGVLNTLIRLGVPFETAALFLSQSSISNIIKINNINNLRSSTSLQSDVINYLKELASKNKISGDSQLNTEKLTEEELIKGLTTPSIEIEYKVLQTLNTLLKIVDKFKMINTATKFNSMNSAVGPLVADNVITEYTLSNYSTKSSIVATDGKKVTAYDIINSNPILSKFYESYNIANKLLSEFSANSNSFRHMINILNQFGLQNAITDRRLLNKLNDFYVSYSLIEKGVVDAAKLNYYIKTFPEEFIKNKIKEKYKDNKLINAIKYKTDKKSGRISLNIDISGVDQQTKELYSAAWADLFKVDTQLALQLFEYNFFRGGIGFTPKTFMNLLPIEGKEAIKGYIDAFRNIYIENHSLAIDQFIRNNWDENKLVPLLTSEKAEFNVQDGDLIVRFFQTKNIPNYVKIKDGKKLKLFRAVSFASEDIAIFTEIQPLGNNGEYIECNISDINTPNSLQDTTSEYTKTTSDQIEEKQTDDYKYDNDEKNRRELAEETLIAIIMNYNEITSREQANDEITKLRNRTEKQKTAEKTIRIKEMEERLKTLGIKYDAELLEEMYKTMCY